MKFIKKFESYDEGMSRESICDILCSQGYSMDELEKFSTEELRLICKKISKNESDYDTDNYMFFANLQNICNMVKEILDMDKDSIDSMLTDGHDWAADHISKSKESISHVYNWLRSDRDKI
jgi:hypothetical protein